jgi:hypothetical protein
MQRVRYVVGIVVSIILLNGCAAAVVPLAALSVAGMAASLVTLVNLAREQYPDINFDSAAPIKVTYQETTNDVWNAVVDMLQESGETLEVVDKDAGVLRTREKNLNDVSWIGKGFGKATFLYSYSITCRDSWVRISVAFQEEKMFLSKKAKNLPEGANMMRHIFFRNLKQKLTPIGEEFDPNQDINMPITD